MAKRNSISGSRLVNLAAMIDDQLHNFYQEELPQEDEREKRKGGLRGPLMAGAAIGGGVAIAKNRDKIAAAIPGIKEGARTAAFRGMRGTADVMGKGSKIAAKASRGIHYNHQGLRNAAGGIAEKLAKGSRKLRKGSMRFFDSAQGQQVAQTLVRLEAKISAMGA